MDHQGSPHELILWKRKPKLREAPHHAQSLTVNSRAGSETASSCIFSYSVGRDLCKGLGTREKVSSGNCQDPAGPVASSSLSLRPPVFHVPLLPSSSLSSLHTCRAEALCLLGVLSPLLPSAVLKSPGAVGPTFLSGSLGPISMFTLERVPGELSLDAPTLPPSQRRVDTCEAVAGHSRRRTDPGSEFLPPSPNKPRAAPVAPGVPAPLPA